MEVEQQKLSNPKPISRRIFCGLAWPEKGYPAYCCVLGERIVAQEKSFDTPRGLEIFMECEAKTLSDLFEFLSNLKDIRCNIVCASMDKKYYNYVSEFKRWRRESFSSTRLKATRSLNFEASLLKVSEELPSMVFPEDSLVKTQLSIFSKNKLTDNEEFYAIKALTMVIGEFSRRVQSDGAEVIPKRSAWY